MLKTKQNKTKSIFSLSWAKGLHLPFPEEVYTEDKYTQERAPDIFSDQGDPT